MIETYSNTLMQDRN